VYNWHVDHVRTDEAAAIERAQAGDTAAFGALVEMHQQVAFRAAYLIVRDAQAAEDVAQEGFVRAYGQIRRFRPGEPFRPWLLRIVQNLALNEVRARGRRHGLAERFRIVAPRVEPAPDHAVLAADEAGTVLRAINELPPDDRVVLHLRYFLELPEREIAAAIGTPPGTVKSRLHRASRRLREVIEARYPDLRERHDG
jgi:RNA polymerase sigma-70 factor (ECF subfamily)